MWSRIGVVRECIRFAIKFLSRLQRLEVEERHTVAINYVHTTGPRVLAANTIMVSFP